MKIILNDMDFLIMLLSYTYNIQSIVLIHHLASSNIWQLFFIVVIFLYRNHDPLPILICILLFDPLGRLNVSCIMLLNFVGEIVSCSKINI